VPTKIKDIKMTELKPDSDIQDSYGDDVRARIDKLENESQEALRQAERRVIFAELKVEAIRAGMIDLDGMAFLDLSQINLTEDGSLAGGTELIGQLKRSKPWLFMMPSSSSVAKVPQSRPNRQKHATEMSNEEYRIARANIIKRSVL
jgi:hypothetical protein